MIVMSQLKKIWKISELWIFSEKTISKLTLESKFKKFFKVVK